MARDGISNVLISTRVSEPEHKVLAESYGFILRDLPMIRIQPLPTSEIKLRQRLNQKKADSMYAFTSRNAVKAILQIPEITNELNTTKIYSVGVQTTDLLEKNGIKVHFTADGNAVSLAEQLISDKATDVIHYCGSMRRDELSQMLLKADISYRDVVVYLTEPVRKIPKHLPDQARFIFFMSPSAVETFFRLGLHHVYDESIYIAIGQTTLKTLLPHPVTTLVAREPSFEAMLQQCR